MPKHSKIIKGRPEDLLQNASHWQDGENTQHLYDVQKHMKEINAKFSVSLSKVCIKV